MIDAATRLPLRHISVRVPWHDNGWNGTVCNRPKENAACLVLDQIRENRDDAKEAENAGQDISEFEDQNFPACLRERGGFMSPFEYPRNLTHPYSATSQSHQHFAPTRYRYPEFSAACTPYRWTLSENAERIAQEYEIGLDWEQEERVRDLMGFKSSWLQEKHNHLAMLDTFFGALQPEQSLCFLYAKRTPLAEDTRRVIVGVGRVAHVGQAVEYAYSRYGENYGKLRSMIWERSVQHSIRPGFSDGFLLPYHQVLRVAEQDPDLDTPDFVAFAPEESWEEFSYGSEHVSHDTAIASLLACADALRAAQKVVEGDLDTPLRWIDARLNELWQMRGPCPGLGSALSAFGVGHGNFVAYDIAAELEENEDPWPLVEQAFEDPTLLERGLERRITPTTVRKWGALPNERRALLKLLSRFNLTADQATRSYQETEREEARISASDADILTNPYLLYESDRFSLDPIALGTVDRGVFPNEVIRSEHPLPEPSGLNDDAVDPRRVRAFMTSVLEDASSSGSTLLPQHRVIQEVRSMPFQPGCPVDSDLMSVVEEAFSPVIERVEIADTTPAYQLSRLAEMGQIIHRQVERRIKGGRHEIEADWFSLLDEELPDPAPEDVEAEKRARQEKVKALQELASSRVSVLIGPAGTGKTTLLSVLCNHPQIRNGGVTLLAPTGKARVQLEKSTNITTKTIAQFLIKEDRYVPVIGNYRLSTRAPVQAGRTVVIDEASMLTEEQLAAVLNAVTGVERLILVGDPRQLPPIGSGRPFVDIVARLEPNYSEGRFPRVDRGYAELTIRRRQTGRSRDDLLLAEWFSGQTPGAGADEVWDRVESRKDSETLRFVSWKDGDDLHDKLKDVLVEELELGGLDDVSGFEQSLGGSPWGDNGWVFFWRGKYGEAGAAGKVEDWQILTPVRGQAHGVYDLNRVVQRHFRKSTLERATKQWRKIPRPFGAEEIVYGDKVINTANKNRKDVFPKDDALMYVANGEIGMVVGQYKGKRAAYRGLPWKLEVEFSSQPGISYGFGGGDFSREGDSRLELAYAITVHKAQGSEFGLTFLIFPSNAMLSRELLYTALTRQRNKVILMHQGDVGELRQHAGPGRSETAQRLTNLFLPPVLVEVGGQFLEENLIHRTRRGEAVRSKSEVIIADLLYTKGFTEYLYEARLVGRDGSVRYPDFTIDDVETGQKVYWEHLGMMHDPEYRARWEKKLAWFRDQHILPFEEGNGSNGTLVITRDDEQGGISSEQLEQRVDEVFGL
ncbi:MAG: AAA family ATPase [Actinomycetota bacterium]|nr:AAA family ATPase [Rubrobacteraceae bacterium]MDQ3497132.1 AAA family ATPase [Actinomycetota bacterium]